MLDGLLKNSQQSSQLEVANDSLRNHYVVLRVDVLIYRRIDMDI